MWMEINNCINHYAYRKCYQYVCLNCNNCIMQVDDLGKEYYACFVKTGITIDAKMMRKLYFELKYRPHAFSDVEKTFFTRFSVNSINSCDKHTAR